MTKIGAGMSAALAAVAVTAVYAADAPPTPKAYVVGEISVTDPAEYQRYAAAALPMVTRFGGHYIARGGKVVPLEGQPAAGRVILIEFPDLEKAKAFEHSPEYRAIAAIRRRSSAGRLFIVEGVAP